MITTMSSSNNKNCESKNLNIKGFKQQQFRFLYLFSLKKTAGWTAIYSILLFLCYPLVIFQENFRIGQQYEDYIDRMNYLTSHLTATSFVVSVLLCAMVLVFSAVLYSYMHGKRSAYFFHSMPVDRSILLTANFAAGFTALVVPIWINSIIAFAAYPICLPKLDCGAIGQTMALEVLAWTMGAFILLAIGTMVAVTVATSVESIGYTVALLLEGSILLLIWDVACNSVFDTYLSIFAGGTMPSILLNVLYYLSPVFALANTILNLLENDYTIYSSARLASLTADSWLPLLFWLLLGIAALWMAVKLYNKRQSERAEQWGRQSYIGFAVKLMSAIIGAFLFAIVLGDALGLETKLTYTFGALTGAPIVYLVIEAITNRGFHNMKKALPWMGAAVAITLVGSFYFACEGFGYDSRIPTAEQVQTVDLELMSYMELTSDKKSDEYAMNWSKDANWNTYSETQEVVLKEQETIDMVLKIHESSIKDTSSYMGYFNVSYVKGGSKVNRRLTLRENNSDRMLELLYSDEYLENYNPFFELKGSYLEMVQITDKLGTIIGEGEIPAESYDKLIAAIRDDMKNATPESLRDADNNAEVALLTFVTKYPKEIYEESGDLYHYDTTVCYAVRAKDSNTRLVLEQLGFKLEIQDSFYDNVKSVMLVYGERNGYLPGVLKDNGVTTEEVYRYSDYYVSDYDVTDLEEIKALLPYATSVYSGYDDQYGVEIYSRMTGSTEISCQTMYISRSVVAQLMADSGNYYVPYILTDEEWDLLYASEKNVERNSEGEIVALQEYYPWEEIEKYGNFASMYDYCKEFCPEILDGKTNAELSCMKETPLYNSEEGAFLEIGW